MLPRLCLPLLCLGCALQAQDARCGRYPESQRAADEVRLERERAFVQASLRARALGALGLLAQGTTRSVNRLNLIDQFLFDKMEADGVQPAPASSDAEFQRRVRFDLTGRIAQPDEVRAFLDDPDPDKRRRLIGQLLDSTAYVDHFTQFYSNLFEVTSNYYNIIGIPGRNGYYRYVRDFVESNRPYDEFVREMLAAGGDNHSNGPVNFMVRGVQQGDPVQDTWDAITDRITTRFLGHKTACISCHNGRPNLAQINLYLYGKRRSDFWALSAFLSRTSLTTITIDPFGNSQRTLVTDRSDGAYYGTVPSNNPGQRPLRTGGPYTPVYLFSGQKPPSGAWRQELAQIVTADRQFARAAVNYLWAKMFTMGIVDPVDGWDLARIDPKNPPPAPWTIQPSHPELIEALADEFIRSGYNVKAMVRMMVESSAYQLSSTHPNLTLTVDKYFARHIPRRLLAEEVYDAVAAATATETPMWVEGFDQPLMFAGQLPDPTEPRRDSNVRSVLDQFGRGDWDRNARNSASTVLQVLFLMNDSEINQRASGTIGGNRNTRVSQLMQSGLSDEEAVRVLFLATLSRPPTDTELDVVNKNRRGTREAWLSDTQWALLNKLDFLFNY